MFVGWYDKLYDIEGIDYARSMEGTPPPLVQTARPVTTTAKNSKSKFYGLTVSL